MYVGKAAGWDMMYLGKAAGRVLRTLEIYFI
jgi:hypothetical protein